MGQKIPSRARYALRFVVFAAIRPKTMNLAAVIHFVHARRNPPRRERILREGLERSILSSRNEIVRLP